MCYALKKKLFWYVPWLRELVPALLCSSIVVIKSNDIVLAKIAARLHLDDFQRNAAGIGESMNFSYRYVCGLVFSQSEHLVAIGDLSRAGHQNLVFSTMVMLL